MIALLLRMSLHPAVELVSARPLQSMCNNAHLFKLLEGAGMSLIHGLTPGSLFEFQTFYRSMIVEDVAWSHKLVRNLALQGVVRGLKDKRQRGIGLRIYISCA